MKPPLHENFYHTPLVIHFILTKKCGKVWFLACQEHFGASPTRLWPCKWCEFMPLANLKPFLKIQAEVVVQVIIHSTIFWLCLFLLDFNVKSSLILLRLLPFLANFLVPWLLFFSPKLAWVNFPLTVIFPCTRSCQDEASPFVLNKTVSIWCYFAKNLLFLKGEITKEIFL